VPSGGVDFLLAWNLCGMRTNCTLPFRGGLGRGLSVLNYNPIMLAKNIVTGQKVTKEKLQRAIELRREMTPAEKILWEELRANRLGVHFRRQQVIEGFIVDFYCHKAGLVIEVDGDVHDLQKEEDERREKVLSALGLRIVRFRNDEVVRELSAVVGEIKSCIIGAGDFNYD
jgi:very-short-patch-repair endonuclease